MEYSPRYRGILLLSVRRRTCICQGRWTDENFLFTWQHDGFSLPPHPLRPSLSTQGGCFHLVVSRVITTELEVLRLNRFPTLNCLDSRFYSVFVYCLLQESQTTWALQCITKRSNVSSFSWLFGPEAVRRPPAALWEVAVDPPVMERCASVVHLNISESSGAGVGGQRVTGLLCFSVREPCFELQSCSSCSPPGYLTLQKGSGNVSQLVSLLLPPPWSHSSDGQRVWTQTPVSVRLTCQTRRGTDT